MGMQIPKNMSEDCLFIQNKLHEQGYTDQDFNILQSNDLEIVCNKSEICRSMICTFCHKNIDGGRIMITNKKFNRTLVLTNLSIHLMKIHNVCPSELTEYLSIGTKSHNLTPAITVSYLNYKRGAYEEFHSYN